MLRKRRKSGSSAGFLFILSLLIVGGGVYLFTRSLNKPPSPKVHTKIMRLYNRISSVPWRNTPEFRKYYDKSVALMLTARTLRDELRAVGTAYIGSVYALGTVGLRSSIYPLAILFVALFLTYGVYYGGVYLRRMIALSTAPYKGFDPISKAIAETWALLKLNPRPASIWYHRPYEGGLFLHSKDVAYRAVEIFRETNPTAKKEVEKLVFLLGLAHDIGKIRIYRYENRKIVTPPDHTGQRKVIKLKGWFNTGAPQLSNTKIVLAGILKKAGFSQRDIDTLLDTLDPDVEVPEKFDKIREIIKKADREITNKEVFEVRDKKKLLDAFFKSLDQLNVNGIYGKDFEGWYNPKQKVVAVLSWSLAKVVTEKLFESYGNEAQELGASLVPSLKDVHPIIPPLVEVLKSEKIIYEKFKNSEGDELCLFNLKAGIKDFRAVLLINPQKLPSKLLKKWTGGLAQVYNIGIKSRVAKRREELVISESTTKVSKPKDRKKMASQMVKNNKGGNNKRGNDKDGNNRKK